MLIIATSNRKLENKFEKTRATQIILFILIIKLYEWSNNEHTCKGAQKVQKVGTPLLENVLTVLYCITSEPQS